MNNGVESEGQCCQFESMMKHFETVSRLAWVAGLFAACQLVLTSCAAAGSKPLYENNFEQAKLDAVPEDFLVLDGEFKVKEEAGNKFLELPGDPLDNFGVLFGPTQTEGVAASARIHGTGKGRRFPAFGVSLNGVGGFKLQVSPAKKALELFQGEELKASVPCDWASGDWTAFLLQVRKVKEGAWRVEGKVWKQGAVKPANWTLSLDVTEEPPSGRAGIWGNPFSGTPIRFDDLAITAIGG